MNRRPEVEIVNSLSTSAKEAGVIPLFTEKGEPTVFMTQLEMRFVLARTAYLTSFPPARQVSLSIIRNSGRPFEPEIYRFVYAIPRESDRRLHLSIGQRGTVNCNWIDPTRGIGGTLNMYDTSSAHPYKGKDVPLVIGHQSTILAAERILEAESAGIGEDIRGLTGMTPEEFTQNRLDLLNEHWHEGRSLFREMDDWLRHDPLDERTIPTLIDDLVRAEADPEATVVAYNSLISGSHRDLVYTPVVEPE